MNDVFDVSTMRAAKEVILTTEDFSTDMRWKKETPYLADLLIEALQINFQDTVLDFGCGIGRIAKEIIEKVGCRVIGVDTSASMRALAASYVNSPKFFSSAPEMMPLFPQFNKVISVWVLQHIPKLSDALVELFESISYNGHIAIVNNVHRALPTNNGGWYSDGLDVSKEMEKFFVPETDFLRLTPEIVGPELSQNTYWRLFKKIGD